MPGAQFPGTFPSSGLFSRASHSFYPHAVYYHAVGTGQGWPSVSPPQPVPCIYPPRLLHGPVYSSYDRMPYGYTPPHLSDNAGLAPSQANDFDATLTNASQCQPRDLDRVDLFMRRFCDVVLNDIACDPYRNDVDEDIGLVVALCVYLGPTCEPGMAYFSKGDCETSLKNSADAARSGSPSSACCATSSPTCASAHT